MRSQVRIQQGSPAWRAASPGGWRAPCWEQSDRNAQPVRGTFKVFRLTSAARGKRSASPGDIQRFQAHERSEWQAHSAGRLFDQPGGLHLNHGDDAILVGVHSVEIGELRRPIFDQRDLTVAVEV